MLTALHSFQLVQLGMDTYTPTVQPSHCCIGARVTISSQVAEITTDYEPMWSDRMYGFETPSKPSSSSILLAAILVAALGVEVSDLLDSARTRLYFRLNTKVS
jgi:hypothetical protein